MSLSTLPLSYCTNVHPARSAGDVLHGLADYAANVQASVGRPIAAGLWLPHPVIRQLSAAGLRESLRAALGTHSLVCYTLNAFPYGDFHGERVKEQVYLPDWSTRERLEYTAACAEMLAELLPDGVEGSLSTVPLGFKGFSHGPDFEQRCIDNLLDLARRLEHLHDETGRVVRLAIEPEPCCVLETTDETLAFFQRLWEAAEAVDQLDVARRRLGVCYDVCHQSVEFEDVAASVARFAEADVRINKVHITCALRLPAPMDNHEGRRALAHYAEPRYLHQTLARTPAGDVLKELDLSASFCETPPAEFAAASEWRTHFHVPVHAESIGPLQTTRDDLRRALQAVSRLPYAPHLEVETYTWGVLPGDARPSLVDGLAAELIATRALLTSFA